MGGTIKNEREKLDGQLKWLERWVVFGGFAVAVGVAVEIGPKVLKREIDNAVIGGAIVILGVAAEAILAFVAAQKTSRVQEIADADVAAANERAANAEKAAAEANLARARVERKFKPRTLTVEAYKNLETALAPYAGTRIDILAFDSHIQEVTAFAYELSTLCRRAGCDCKLWMPSVTTPRMMGASVVLATALESTPEQNEMFSPISMAFAQALARSDIKVSAAIHGFSKKAPVKPPEPAPSFLPWREDDVASFRIQIVEKTLLDGPFGP